MATAEATMDNTGTENISCKFVDTSKIYFLETSLFKRPAPFFLSELQISRVRKKY